MKDMILWFVLSCLMLFSFMGTSLAEDLESTCNEDYNRCADYCDEKYFTPEKDVWGNLREESEITYSKRVKCKNNCLTIMDGCIDRKRNLEIQNTQTQPSGVSPFRYRNLGEDQGIQDQEDVIYENSPSDTNVYKWTDKDGVVHVTNKKESIPSEYLDQIEETSSKEETNTTEEKNKIEQGSIIEKKQEPSFEEIRQGVLEDMQKSTVDKQRRSIIEDIEKRTTE